MQSISTRIEDDVNERIGEIADDRGSSTSAVVRDLIDKGLDYDDLETENERLRRQLAATNRRVDEHQDLVEYVEEQREIEHERQERDRERRQTPVWRRAKWWVLGEPEE